MKAIGIHAHPTMKLGLKPSPTNAPRLMLRDYLTGNLPSHPSAADYLAGITFGMYANDRFGVCGPTSVANSRRLITARLTGKMVAPTQADVFDLYRRSGNPNFDPNTGADDNGVDMHTMLTAVATGGIGGVKCLGFAAVDWNDTDTLDAAIAIVGCPLVAVLLETAQQDQTDRGTWDYSPSGTWGGHAILAGAYESTFDDVITWAQRVKMTDAFQRHQIQEVWVVLWPEHMTDKGFLAGVNLKAFAADWSAMTGQKFPVPIPPSPTPPPSPPPSPPTPTPGPSMIQQWIDNYLIKLATKYPWASGLIFKAKSYIDSLLQGKTQAELDAMDLCLPVGATVEGFLPQQAKDLLLKIIALAQQTEAGDIIATTALAMLAALVQEYA